MTSFEWLQGQFLQITDYSKSSVIVKSVYYQESSLASLNFYPSMRKVALLYCITGVKQQHSGSFGKERKCTLVLSIGGYGLTTYRRGNSLWALRSLLHFLVSFILKISGSFFSPFILVPSQKLLAGYLWDKSNLSSLAWEIRVVPIHCERAGSFHSRLVSVSTFDCMH